KYFFEQPIGLVTITQSITMMDVKGFAMIDEYKLIVNDTSIQFFFKIAKHPHVMIALEKCDLYTPICQLRQFAEEANIPFGHDRFIFKPKIENISYQIEFRGIIFYRIQPSDNRLFAKAGFVVRKRAQVKIRSKVYFISHDTGYKSI